ncbi:GNAT family N-acetyltransferase [Rubrobacter tropicus]|uniref:GNAT family N-acetyltransferase n=1 Tax=Rubrobacter tropicus TaxID=2653851 RepID=A0A6G8Q4J1_9ACTN|nr:GNAT family N-acetyltransferase [Rubrobacter tropicus]QIN81358.1 GNAT family N-acetyltransferase [Rubrobacter tropicus]
MEGLPAGFSRRPPTPEDAGAVAGLMAACVRVDGGAQGTSVEHVLDDWREVDLAEEAVLVSAPDGTVAGYADVVNRAFVSLSVYGYVHPEHRGRGIGAWLVGWGEDWIRDRTHLAPAGVRIVVKHYVISTSEDTRRLLESKGYEAVRGTYVMEVDLEGPPPSPAWPEGLGPRAFVPGRDDREVFEAVEDAFRDVWGRPGGTFERFAGRMAGEDFDPSMWFLATDGNEIAGSVLCKTVAGEGWVEVVGVRRPWRGRGLGLALLRHAFAEYHRRGIRKVGLSVDAQSVTGAPRLYGRAGMRTTSSYVVYQKELRPGEDFGPTPAP